MISIIIPTYNSAKTIKRCLDSIVAQTYKDYEVLVMDGCSTDETIEIIESYPDERIKIASEPDKGIYDAMNKGILKSKGEWLYFLGSDDYLFAPDVLEKVSKELSGKYDVVYGEVDAPQLPQECKGEWTYDNILANRCHQAIFYRRTVFKEIGLYNLQYRLWADWDLNYRWYCCPTIRHQYVNMKIAYYSDGGISSKQGDEDYEKIMAYNLLVNGRTVFTVAQRRRLAGEALFHFTEKELKYYVIRVYIYYLRILKKLGVQ